jgi:hypothetical protein
MGFCRRFVEKITHLELDNRSHNVSNIMENVVSRPDNIQYDRKNADNEERQDKESKAGFSVFSLQFCRY